MPYGPLRQLGCLVLFTLAATALGCASPAFVAGRESAEADVSGWVATHGGTVDGPPKARAERALASLLMDPGNRRPLTIAVLGAPTVGAFGWPGGQLFVTRGLIEQVDDAQLAAAIAHEVGHLIVDGHADSPAALRGGRTGHGAGHESEVAADRAAHALLCRAGQPAGGLVRLLDRLAADGGFSAAQRRGLRDRAERLRDLGPAD